MVLTISVDNIAYSHLIGEQLRTRVEQSGHVELSDANLHEIQVDRRTYGVLLGGGLLRSLVIEGIWPYVLYQAPLPAVLAQSAGGLPGRGR